VLAHHRRPAAQEPPLTHQSEFSDRLLERHLPQRRIGP
jgi:hypothetical protein